MYAGSSDCYTKFNKLFDRVIREYHHVDDEEVHTMKCAGDLVFDQNADFTKDDESLILSTRVRVSRNFAGYPLGLGTNQE